VMVNYKLDSSFLLSKFEPGTIAEHRCHSPCSIRISERGNFYYYSVLFLFYALPFFAFLVL